MKRSSALVGTAAAAAVLVAGSVAALAAINTAASASPAVEKIAVVDDQPMAAGGLTPIEFAPLPEIVPAASAASVIVTAADITSADPASTPSAKSGTASSKPTTQQARSLTADEAASIVNDQVEGKSQVTDISRTEHDGYDSWAVTVDKADGSRLVGYVYTGATGSEVFDWKVLKEPNPIVVSVPATNTPASAKPAQGNYENEYGKHESDEHESHEGEHDDD